MLFFTTTIQYFLLSVIFLRINANNFPTNSTDSTDYIYIDNPNENSPKVNDENSSIVTNLTSVKYIGSQQQIDENDTTEPITYIPPVPKNITTVPFCNTNATAKKCIEVISERMTWNESFHHCRQLNGFLAHPQILQSNMIKYFNREINKIGDGYDDLETPDLRGSDDRTCTDAEFQCLDGMCVMIVRRCDGYQDCYDGTDEDNCIDFIWTGLRVLNHQYQWIVEQPYLDPFSEVSKFESDTLIEGCPSYSLILQKFTQNSCSDKKLFLCYVTRTETDSIPPSNDFELHILSGDDYQEGLVELSEKDFKETQYCCRWFNKRTKEYVKLDWPVFWNKDGIYLKHYTSTIDLATVHEPAKSTIMNSDIILPTKQGNIQCESWLPNRQDTIKSSSLLVLIKGWETFIITLVTDGFDIDPNNIQRSDIEKYTNFIRTNLFGQNSEEMQTWPMDMISIINIKQSSPITTSTDNDSITDYLSTENYEEITKDFNSRIMMENQTSKNSILKFHFYMPEKQAIEEGLKINDHNLILLNSKYLDGSSVKMVQYCSPENETDFYGNDIMWPLNKVGSVYPSNTQCLSSSNFPVGRNCKADFVNGAKLESLEVKLCNHFNRCPKGYLNIDNKWCLLITSPSSWIDAMNDAHVTGMELDVCTFIQSYMKVFDKAKEILSLDAGFKLWLPMRRLRKFGPVKKIKFGTRNNELSCDNITNRWALSHPDPDKDCVAIDVTNFEVYTIGCETRLPFLSALDLSTLELSSQTESTLLEMQPSCDADSYKGYSPIYNSKDRVCVLILNNLYANVSSHAKSACDKILGTLPQPGRGYMNWIYRDLLVNKKYKQIFIEDNSEINDLDYYNWKPQTQFTSNEFVMDVQGWGLKKSTNETLEIICEKNEKIVKNLQQEFKLFFVDNEFYICVDTTGLDYVTDSLECFIDGSTKIETNTYPHSSICNSRKVLVSKSLSGYFSCSIWTKNPHSWIQSNVLLKRPKNEYVYIIKLWRNDTNYDPLKHDSTFMSNSMDNNQTCKNTSIYSEVIKLLSDVSSSEDITCYYIFFAPQEQSNGMYEFIQFIISNAQKSPYNILKNSMTNFVSDIYKDIEIRKTTGCLYDVYTDTFDKQYLTFPATDNSGLFTPKELCVTKNGFPATRRCNGDYLQGFYWSDELNEECSTDVTELTKNLYETSVHITSHTIHKLKEITDETADLQPIDIFLISNSLESVDELLDDNKNKSSIVDGYEDLSSVINNILSVNDETIISVQNILNTNNKILRSFESLSFKLNSSIEGYEARSFKKYVSSERVNLKSNPDIIGYLASDYDAQKENTKILKNDSELNYKNAKVAIVLPKSTTNFRDEKQENLVNFVVFRNSKLFIEPSSFQTNLTVNSYIIQTSFYDREIGKLDTPVEIYFRPLYNTTHETYCAFWDFNKHGENGGWSTKGCRKGKDTLNFTTCLCDHLTNFALLVNYDGSVIEGTHAIILDTITIVGSCLSIFALLLLFLTFFLFEEWRRSLNNKILFNMSLAIFFSMVIFVTGINQTEDPFICRGVAVALHYFILASFGWMLVEGVRLYMLFVKVIGTYIPRFLWKASICAWGIPILPVVAMLVYDSSLYDSNKLYHQGSEICWMSPTGFLYGFLPPLIITMFVNLVFYGIIIYRVIIRRQKISSTVSQKSIQTQQVMMAISFFILLGFTWIFGLLAVFKARLLFSYLFCIFNTLQGFFLFVFYVFKDRTARRLWSQFVSVIPGRSYSSNDSKPSSSRSENTNTARAQVSFSPKGKKKKVVSVDNPETVSLSSSTGTNSTREHSLSNDEYYY